MESFKRRLDRFMDRGGKLMEKKYSQELPCVGR